MSPKTAKRVHLKKKKKKKRKRARRLIPNVYLKGKKKDPSQPTTFFILFFREPAQVILLDFYLG